MVMNKLYLNLNNAISLKKSYNVLKIEDKQMKNREIMSVEFHLEKNRGSKRNNYY